MDELKKYMCNDVIGIVDEFMHGDKEYWRDKYKTVYIVLNFCQLICLITNKNCSVCVYHIYQHVKTFDDLEFDAIDALIFTKLVLKNHGIHLDVCNRHRSYKYNKPIRINRKFYPMIKIF